ncbi:MAG: calcium/sodium antiporter [Oscillospiraceae bacterium]
MLNILFLVIGFILLIKGADLFVDSSSALATRLRIPPIIIGLTVVAFGTSAPEAAVSISASISGSNDIAIGNIIGSNLFNLLMVSGISALLLPIAISRDTIRRDFPMSLVSAVLLLVLSLVGIADMQLTRIDGIILLLFFCWFMYTSIHSARAFQKSEAPVDLTTIDIMPLPKSIIIGIIGIVGIVLGGHTVVIASTSIARIFGISERLIGLTIVAIGTSLPELVTSVVAAKKGQADIAMGNVLGSNMFNIFFILGISAFISPLTIALESIIDTSILIAVSAIAYFIAWKNKKISRLSGGFLVAIYIIYAIYIIMR